MDKYISQKIKVTSFLLVIMVVFLHSYNLDIKQAGKILLFEKDANWFLQHFISNGITRIAVPLFFLISGFLFISKPVFTFSDYKIKATKRIRTLVVPYLFWTLFGLFFYFVLQSIPQSQGFFTKKLIADYTFSEWMNTIFNEPIPYQLWFLKDLIVMVFLSPLIYILVSRIKAIFLMVVFAFWLGSQDSIFLTSEALLFFSLGIYIHQFKSGIISNQVKNRAALFLLWMAVLFIKTTLSFYDCSAITEQLLRKVSILIGIIAFWNALDSKLYTRYFDSRLRNVIGFSFFIYVSHEPFLTIIKKALFSLLEKTPATYLLVYLSAPMIIIAITLLMAVFLQKTVPACYKIITGDR